MQFKSRNALKAIPILATFSFALLGADLALAVGENASAKEPSKLPGTTEAAGAASEHAGAKSASPEVVPNMEPPAAPVKDAEVVSKVEQTKASDASAAEKKKRDDAFNLGSTLYKQKKYDAAIKQFSLATASHQDDGNAGIMLGYCYYAKKQYPQALAQYKNVAAHGTLISVKNQARELARVLDCYMKHICPGNCLKPSMPGWRKMTVPGCPDRLVWMVYPYLDPAGKGGSEYWSNDHMGEVIEYVKGRPINKGRCPICGGTGTVSLP